MNGNWISSVVKSSTGVLTITTTGFNNAYFCTVSSSWGGLTLAKVTGITGNNITVELLSGSGAAQDFAFTLMCTGS